MDRYQAELAAKEEEALKLIKQDVCQWVSRVLSLNITSDSFMQVLDNGVPLYALVTAIQTSKAAADREGRQLDIVIPMNSLKCNEKAESRSFFARDNTANFITWCRQLGVEEAVVFESDGLVEHKDERRVILCLLDVARFAEKVGISPPELVKMERDIPSLLSAFDSRETSVSPEPAEEEEEEEEEEELQYNGSGKLNKSHDNGDNNLPKCDKDVNDSVTKGDQSDDNEATKQDNPAAKQSRDDNEAPQPKRLRLEHDETEPSADDGSIRTALDASQQAGEGVSSEVMTVPSKVEDPKVEKKDLSVEERVLIEVKACKCRPKMRVKHCGNGKFVIKKSNGRLLTFYARMLSDSVMVRVGGGWDTLEHFLLKHDSCRILALTSNQPKPPAVPSSSLLMGPSPYEARPFSRGILPPRPRGKRPRET